APATGVDDRPPSRVPFLPRRVGAPRQPRAHGCAATRSSTRLAEASLPLGRDAAGPPAWSCTPIARTTPRRSALRWAAPAGLEPNGGSRAARRGRAAGLVLHPDRTVDAGEERTVMASTGRSCSERRQPGRARWSAYARPSRRGARLAPLALIVLAACSGERSAPTEPAADEAPRIEVALALRWDDLEDRLRMEVSVGNRDPLGPDVIIPSCRSAVDVYNPDSGRHVLADR